MSQHKSIHFQIAEMTSQSKEVALRNASYYASSVAISNTDLENPLIREALYKLEKSEVDLELKMKIESLAEEQDVLYLNLQDSFGSQSNNEREIIQGFHRARAAAAIAAALHSNAKIAAQEAIYEAYHIVEDKVKFINDIQQILNNKPS